MHCARRAAWVQWNPCTLPLERVVPACSVKAKPCRVACRPALTPRARLLFAREHQGARACS